MVNMLFDAIVLLLFGTVGLLLLLFEAILFGAMVKLLLDTLVLYYFVFYSIIIEI